MSITDWPTDERPREKLLQRGPAALSDAELLAIFLRTGVAGKSAVDLGRDLILRFGSLTQLFSASQNDFCETHGMGQAKLFSYKPYWKCRAERCKKKCVKVMR